MLTVFTVFSFCVLFGKQILPRYALSHFNLYQSMACTSVLTINLTLAETLVTLYNNHNNQEAQDKQRHE